MPDQRHGRIPLMTREKQANLGNLFRLGLRHAFAPSTQTPHNARRAANWLQLGIPATAGTASGAAMYQWGGSSPLEATISGAGIGAGLSPRTLGHAWQRFRSAQNQMARGRANAPDATLEGLQGLMKPLALSAGVPVLAHSGRVPQALIGLSEASAGLNDQVNLMRPQYAGFDGTIKSIGPHPNNASWTVITYDNGQTQSVSPGRKLNVTEGQTVKAGDPLAGPGGMLGSVQSTFDAGAQEIREIVRDPKFQAAMWAVTAAAGVGTAVYVLDRVLAWRRQRQEDEEKKKRPTTPRAPRTTPARIELNLRDHKGKPINIKDPDQFQNVVSDVSRRLLFNN